MNIVFKWCSLVILGYFYKYIVKVASGSTDHLQQMRMITDNPTTKFCSIGKILTEQSSRILISVGY